MRTHVFSGLSGLFLLLGAPLAAQDEPPTPPNCPLNISSGEWNLAVTGTNNATSGFDGSEVPVPPIGDALTFLPSCEAGLSIVSRGGIRVDLTGRSDGTFPSEFEGSGTIAGPITAEWSITVESQIDALGRLSLGGLINQIANGEAVFYDMTYAGEEGDDHPACRCPTQLRAALSDHIQDAKRLQDLFADTKFHERPRNFSPDVDPLFQRWNVVSYEQLVVYLYHNPEATYEQAVAYADSVTSDGGQIRIGANGDATADAVSGPGETLFSASGSTTFDKEKGMCVSSVTSGTDSCYPEIAFSAVSVHEGVHYADCIASNAMHKEIPLAADSEVRAYGAEIEYLRNWIPNNCPSPVANVTD